MWGISSNSLVNSSLWFRGPNFLSTSDFFSFVSSPSSLETSLETYSSVQGKAQISLGVAVVSTLSNFIDQFSSYKCLIAVVGRVIMFVHPWKMTWSKEVKYSTSLSDCFISAHLAVIRLFQVTAIAEEITQLQSNKSVSAKSPLRCLDPFIDSNGIPRVSGQIQNANVSYSMKHPIIVPRGCTFIRIYVPYHHTEYYHARKSFIFPFVQAEFWVCGGLTNLVKSIIKSCVICARYHTKTYHQILGQLSTVRVTPARPFANTGLDFCGPFSVWCTGPCSIKINKLYAYIFVCMAT